LPGVEAIAERGASDISAVLLDAKGVTKRAGCERNFLLWPVRREGPPADPIDFLTGSPIQGCWIYKNRAKDQTMKGCVESPKDLRKGRKQIFRSPPNPRAFLAPTAIFQITNTHCKNLRLSIRVKIYAYGI